MINIKKATVSDFGLLLEISKITFVESTST